MDCKLSSAELKAIRDAFIEWCSRKRQKHISILVTGKTGVGKSRLVNALVGKPVAIEGQAKNPCTYTVTAFSIDIEGIEVRIWDSPGLQDGTSNDELYLEDLTKKLHQGMDVMIYCLKMGDRRFHEDDKRAMRTLTRAFGKELWKNAVIALTFANKVKDPDKRDKEAYFLRDLSLWQQALEVFLTRELNFDFEMFEAIPIVTAGDYHKLLLPNCENWLSELWTKCYCVMKDSAAFNFYRINKNRLEIPGSEEITAACGYSENEAHQPLSSLSPSQSTNFTDIPRAIPLNDKQQESFWEKTWRMFKACCKTVGHVVLSAISHLVLKFIFII